MRFEPKASSHSPCVKDAQESTRAFNFVRVTQLPHTCYLEFYKTDLVFTSSPFPSPLFAIPLFAKESRNLRILVDGVYRLSRSRAPLRVGDSKPHL